jgi:hypothetical protein
MCQDHWHSRRGAGNGLGLIVVVMGLTPIKTELVFDSLENCWQARQQVQSLYSELANRELKWSRENLEGEQYEAAEAMIVSRLTTNAMTCIPYSWETK